MRSDPYQARARELCIVAESIPSPALARAAVSRPGVSIATRLAKNIWRARLKPQQPRS